MPNHCFQATNENPVPNNTDFQVIFNRDVTGMTNYDSSDIDSEEKTTELLCDIQRTAESNMMSGTGYSEYNSNGVLQ